MSSGSRSPFRDTATHALVGATVLQIIPDLEPGPVADAAIGAAAALSRIGANALIASRGGALVSELQARGGLFAPFPADARNPVGMAMNVRRLAKLIRKERVDVVHARSRASAWVAFAATRATLTPFVTSFQGNYARGGPLALRYNSVMARGDVIIADSAFTAGVVGRLYPKAAGKIHIVPCGIDCRVFAPRAVAPGRVQAVRGAWGAAQDERIVYLAAGLRGSGAKELVEAVALLRVKSGADDWPGGTKFILFCDEPRGSVAKEIDAAIAKAGLQQIMRRCAESDDRAAALLAASAVAAFPAQPEALVRLVLEAQAMGAPVIVGEAGAASETILAPPEVDDSARTGWRASDAAAMASALRAALNLGATARDRLSLRARAHVETRFSVEQSLARTLAAYAAARDGGESAAVREA